MRKRYLFTIVAALALVGLVAFLRWGSGSTALIWQLSNSGQWLAPLVVVSALLDSINPCAFSVLLLTIAFLFSIGRMRSSVLRIGSVYILGIFIAYLLIGLGLLQALHLFSTPHFMAKVGAGLLIALGLINVLGDLFPKFPVKLRIPAGAHHWMAKLLDKATIPTAFLLGGLVGLCEFPCTGGPYLAVIGMLHDRSTFTQGFGYLLVYNLLFVLPLVILLLLAGSQPVLEKLQQWQQRERRLMRLGGGALMVALGVAIYLM